MVLEIFSKFCQTKENVHEICHKKVQQFPEYETENFLHSASSLCKNSTQLIFGQVYRSKFFKLDKQKVRSRSRLFSGNFQRQNYDSFQYQTLGNPDDTVDFENHHDWVGRECFNQQCQADHHVDQHSKVCDDHHTQHSCLSRLCDPLTSITLCNQSRRQVPCTCRHTFSSMPSQHLSCCIAYLPYRDKIHDSEHQRDGSQSPRHENCSSSRCRLSSSSNLSITSDTLSLQAKHSSIHGQMPKSHDMQEVKDEIRKLKSIISDLQSELSTCKLQIDSLTKQTETRRKQVSSHSSNMNTVSDSCPVNMAHRCSTSGQG